MSMLNNLLKMIMADPAAVAELQAMTAAGPAVTREPAKAGKRTLTDEQKAKMAAGRAAAAAARAAATGKAPAPVVAAKPAKGKGKGKTPVAALAVPCPDTAVVAIADPRGKGSARHFRVKFGAVDAGIGQRDRKKRAWVPLWINGEYAGSMRADLARAMFIAIRGEQAGALLTHIESQR